MREKLQQFMTGRYGADQFGQFLNIVVLVLLVLSLLGVPLASPLGLGLLIYEMYRMLSRNVQKRTEENEFYLGKQAQVKKWFVTRKSRFAQRNTYRYLRCPSCRQELRVPKGRGNITVTCPKCHTQFDQKS